MRPRLPLVEARGRHGAAMIAEGRAIGGTLGDRLGPGINRLVSVQAPTESQGRACSVSRYAGHPAAVSAPRTTDGLNGYDRGILPCRSSGKLQSQGGTERLPSIFAAYGCVAE